MENKIENGNGECAKETTTRPSRQQQKVTNRSSMQREIPAPGDVLQLGPKQIYTSSVIMNAIQIVHKKLKFKIIQD